MTLVFLNVMIKYYFSSFDVILASFNFYVRNLWAEGDI